MRKIPIGMQASVITIFEDVLADMRLVVAPLSANGKVEADSKKS